MASTSKRLPLLLALLLAGAAPAHPQAETVPVSHPVYRFLKRMEVKGVVDRYFDAVLPLSRSEVLALLRETGDRDSLLGAAEREVLRDFRSEFRDAPDGNAGLHSLIDGGTRGIPSGGEGWTAARERYLYAYRDSAVALFANALLNADTRACDGDALGRAGATYLQFGARIRGSVFGRLGFSLEATNAQFWGNRALLQRDPLIRQSYALGTLDAKNFDHAEGSVRYEAEPVSVQIGRERALWGAGIDQRMVLSDNPRVFDFLRADFRHRGLKYTFLHAWLLGRRSSVAFTLPSDTAAVFSEPVVADKYFAAHRVELSLGSAVDLGAQEMVVYSNRSPDLAYLNPLTVIESAQRARGERDNVMWAFDIQTRFLRGVQMNATVLFDDLHLAQFFDDFWYNRYAYQAGVILADPLGAENTTVMVEYTRIEPYVFAHNRSRDNDFGSQGDLLGPRIGPNADSWFFRVDVVPRWNLRLSAGVLLVREGENETDSAGRLLRNVGGDFLQPHRESDPLTRTFLDGIPVRRREIALQASWEFFPQLWVEAEYRGEQDRNPGGRTEEHTAILRLRTEW